MPALLSDSTTEASFWIIVACLAVLVLAIGGFFLGAWLRRRLLQDDSSAHGGFGLGDLRRLVKEGKMTQAEYDKAREQIVTAMKKKADSIPPNRPQ